MKKESMLEAFLRQTEIKPDSYEQTEEYEKKLEAKEKTEQMKRFYEQAGEAFQEKPIADHMKIPSKLNSGDINQKTKASTQMQGYDHSLEEDRWRKIGGKDDENNDDGIIMEDI